MARYSCVFLWGFWLCFLLLTRPVEASGARPATRAWRPDRLSALTLTQTCKAPKTRPFSIGALFKQSVQLAYARPLTVAEEPSVTCRKLNVATGIRVPRLAPHSLLRDLGRIQYAGQLSYAFFNSPAYSLQKIEPGLQFFGAISDPMQIRLYFEFYFESYWNLRVENTLQLAWNEDSDWRATLRYTF